MARSRIQYANHRNLDETFICTKGHMEGMVIKLVGAFKHGYDGALRGEVQKGKFIPLDLGYTSLIVIGNKQLKEEYKPYKIPKGVK